MHKKYIHSAHTAYNSNSQSGGKKRKKERGGMKKKESALLTKSGLHKRAWPRFPFAMQRAERKKRKGKRGKRGTHTLTENHNERCLSVSLALLHFSSSAVLTRVAACQLHHPHIQFNVKSIQLTQFILINCFTTLQNYIITSWMTAQKMSQWLNELRSTRCVTREADFGQNLTRNDRLLTFPPRSLALNAKVSLSAQSDKHVKPNVLTVLLHNNNSIVSIFFKHSWCRAGNRKTRSRANRG